MPEHRADWKREKWALGRWASLMLLLLGVFLICSWGLVSADPVRDGVATSDRALAAEPTPYYYLNPAMLELSPDGIGDMEIHTSQVTDLAGVQFSLQWDPTLVEVIDADPVKQGVQITKGDLFHGYNTFSPANGNLVDNAAGELSYAIALVGSDIGVSGAFHIATIRYHAIGNHTSSVVFTGTIIMAGRGGVDILSGFENGEIRVVGPTLTPTVTPTETAIPTIPAPTGTVTPTVPPPTATPSATPTVSCWDIAEDGSFDDPYSDAWVLRDNALASDEHPRTGEKSLWLAGFNNARDSAYQDVYIPASVTAATFSYWLDVRTDETLHPFDYMYVEVLDTSGALLASLATHSDAEVGQGWRQSSFDLAAFAGQTVRLSFRSLADHVDFTSFFVDDVLLEICAHGHIEPTPVALLYMPLVQK